MKELIYLPDVVTLQIDDSKCSGCGMCLKVCPHEVFELLGRKARIVRRDHCMECGACEMNCPEGALSVNSGVGCAAGIINGILNNTEPNCDCGGTENKCC